MSCWNSNSLTQMMLTSTTTAHNKKGLNFVQLCTTTLEYHPKIRGVCNIEPMQFSQQLFLNHSLTFKLIPSSPTKVEPAWLALTMDSLGKG